MRKISFYLYKKIKGEFNMSERIEDLGSDRRLTAVKAKMM